MEEQQQKSPNSSLPSKQESYQQRKPTNFWMKRWKVPSDLQYMPGFKVNNMIKMIKTTPLERLGYHQVLNTWKQRSQEASEKPLANSLLQNTTKLTTSNEYLKQQSPVPQLKEVEEDISRIQLGTTLEEDVDSMDEVEQKTILGGGEDVGPQPSTTTVTSAILTVQHQQTIQHREHPVSNATQITTLTTTTSINTTDSTTINTIKPYYKLNNKLHHSLRWHPTGQSPTTFSPLLENNNQSPLAPISNSKWLQDLIFQETDPMEESKESDNNRRSTSH
ncbi:hypothetical protein G6F43_005974 [Rhizopus delemar]|nr:hypothetical protein G6F43_005974 [Rhizopus delemar]